MAEDKEIDPVLPEEVDSADKPVGVVNPEDASEEDAEAAMLKMLEGLPQEERSASAEDINFEMLDRTMAESNHRA